MHTISGAKSLAGQIYTGVRAGLMNLSWRIFLKRQWRWKKGLRVRLDADIGPRWFYQIAVWQNKPNQVAFFANFFLLTVSLFVAQKWRGEERDERRSVQENEGAGNGGWREGGVVRGPKCGHFYGSHNWPQSSKSCRFAPERFTRRRRINMLASSYRQMEKCCAKALMPYKILIFAIVCYRELRRPFADVNNGTNLYDALL